MPLYTNSVLLCTCVLLVVLYVRCFIITCIFCKHRWYKLLVLFVETHDLFTACSMRQQAMTMNSRFLIIYLFEQLQIFWFLIYFIHSLTSIPSQRVFSLNKQRNSWNKGNKYFCYIIVNKCKNCPSIDECFRTTIHEINDNAADGCSKRNNVLLFWNTQAGNSYLHRNINFI